MKYTDNTQFKEYVKSLVGKQIMFKLTDEVDDNGLIGTLNKFNGKLIIERDALELEISLNELYYIERFQRNNESL